MSAFPANAEGFMPLNSDSYLITTLSTLLHFLVAISSRLPHYRKSTSNENMIVKSNARDLLKMYLMILAWSVTFLNALSPITAIWNLSWKSVSLVLEPALSVLVSSRITPLWGVVGEPGKHSAVPVAM